LVSWLVAALGIRPFWNLLGVIEIATGVLAALRPISARASVIGSGMAIATFLTTLTFLYPYDADLPYTTPGSEQSPGGFPALSALPGQFLLKDVVLLGAAVWSLKGLRPRSGTREYERLTVVPTEGGVGTRCPAACWISSPRRRRHRL
jgi:uncharacterized membrane protein YkgB